MIEVFYTMCNAFCAMSFRWQIAVGLLCVLITAAVIYLVLWGLKAFIYRLAESMGIILDADYEPYDPEWMDFDAWEAGR